jgi:hypothetical protein
MEGKFSKVVLQLILMREYLPLLLAFFVILTSGCTSDSPIDSAQEDVSADYEYVLNVPEDSSISDTREAISDRMNLYNITYAKITGIEDGENSSVLVYTPNRSDEEIRESLRPASFYTSVNIYVSEDSKIELGENYSVEFDSESLTINNVEVGLGETKTVNNVDITYEGPVNDRDYANISAKVYDSSDVLSFGKTRITKGRSSGSFTYSIPVVVEEDAGKRMRDLTRNFEVDNSGRRLTNSIDDTAYLNVFFKRDKISELVIKPIFQQDIRERSTIQGGTDTSSEAEKRVEKIIYSIRAGKLPEGISIQKVNKVNSTDIDQ